jgi:hypothetical protein
VNFNLVLIDRKTKKPESIEKNEAQESNVILFILNSFMTNNINLINNWLHFLRQYV